MPRPILILGTIVHSLSLSNLEILENAALAVDATGRIAFLERDLAEEKVMTRWEALQSAADTDGDVVRLTRDQLLFPGFIDTHIHAPQYPNAGIGLDLPLLDWLKKYTFPTESKFSSPNFARTIYPLIVRATLRNGTTTAAYYATIHREATRVLAEVCKELGQRSFVGKVCMDANSPDDYIEASAEQSLADTRASIQDIRSLDPESVLVRPIITPRFAPSCTPSLLSSLGKLSLEEDLRVQTHMSENTSELDLVRETFPEEADYASVYNAHALLHDRTVLAHCIHLSHAEIELIKARGSGVAHCPTSNCALGSGMCQVRRLLDAGIEVGLGTDVSGGYAVSILSTIRDATSVSRLAGYVNDDRGDQLSFPEVLYLATLGGANVLSIEAETGNFIPGKWFDALLVDLSPSSHSNVQVFEDEDTETRLSKWVFCGDDRNLGRVWVGGRSVVKGGEVEVGVGITAAGGETKSKDVVNGI
ncbi:hypothetical protein YB2330_000307 [Saitoella coloradoensis]